MSTYEDYRLSVLRAAMASSGLRAWQEAAAGVRDSCRRVLWSSCRSTRAKNATSAPIKTGAQHG